MPDHRTRSLVKSGPIVAVLTLLFTVFTVFIQGCATGSKRQVTQNSKPSMLTEKPLPGLTQADSEVVVEEILQEDAILGFDEKETQVAEQAKSDKGKKVTKEDILAKRRLRKRAKRESKGQIPVELNKRVGKWIHYFTVRDRDRFQRYLNRGFRYKKMVENVFREQGLPEELFFLGIIESGFNVHANSHAGAGGIWQFIKATGKRYGLNRSYYYDERRDPMRSTRAAAAYLKDLHNLFQSWHLAMAAYNAGERRVMRGILRSKSRNYWTIVRKRNLPPETRDYVPKFLAAYIVGRNPEKFGFKTPEFEELPELLGVEVPSPIRLKNLARVSHMTEKELKGYNPHLVRNVTPPNKRKYKIWLPVENANRLAAYKPNLHKLRVTHLAKPSDRKTPRRGWRAKYHKIRRGQNLGSIARRYGLSVRQLKRLNGLKSNRIYAGQRLVVAETKQKKKSGVGRWIAKNSKKDSIRTSRAKTFRYRVRRGESLYSIARKFGTTVAQLKRINGMSRSKILAGQKIRVPQT